MSSFYTHQYKSKSLENEIKNLNVLPDLILLANLDVSKYQEKNLNASHFMSTCPGLIW